MDAIGPGESTGSSGKLSPLTRIDAGERVAALGRGSDGIAIARAAGREDDPEDRIPPRRAGFRQPPLCW